MRMVKNINVAKFWNNLEFGSRHKTSSFGISRIGDGSFYITSKSFSRNFFNSFITFGWFRSRKSGVKCEM